MLFLQWNLGEEANTTGIQYNKRIRPLDGANKGWEKIGQGILYEG